MGCIRPPWFSLDRGDLFALGGVGGRCLVEVFAAPMLGGMPANSRASHAGDDASGAMAIGVGQLRC